MAGVTPTGFVTKTFTEIRDAIYTDATSEDFFGADFPTTPDSPFGNYTSIISAAIKESAWDLAQMVYDQLDIAKAEGINLDKIGAYIGLDRLEASGSEGILVCKGVIGEEVPQGTTVKSNTSDIVVEITSDNIYDNTACYESFISIPTVSDDTTYTISVNGLSYSIVSGSGATEQEILDALVTSLTGSSNFTVTENNGIIEITAVSRSNSLSVIASNNLVIDYVSLITRAGNLEVGAVTILANTLTIFEVTPTGSVSVNNPLDFNLGRLDETDEEYRIRLGERKANTGTATNDALVSSVSNISGVTSVTILENDTVDFFGSGQPPKSFQLFVLGGDENTIAQTIWDTKASTIKTFGNVLRLVEDVQGNTQTVYFSRPDQSYAYINVTYTIYSEEDFPSNGETLIAAAVVDYGNNLDVGEDVIPKRFASAVYDAVDGLDDVTVEIGLSDAVDPPETYSLTRIPVDNTESVIFQLGNVSVSV